MGVHRHEGLREEREQGALRAGGGGGADGHADAGLRAGHAARFFLDVARVGVGAVRWGRGAAVVGAGWVEAK